MNAWRIPLSLAALVLMLPAGASAYPPAEQGTTYRVQHGLTVKDIPKDAKSVRIWFWVPDDDNAQRVLNLDVDKAPAGYKLTRDPINGHRYLYAEVKNPKSATVDMATSFLVQRKQVSIELDPKKAKPLTDVHRALFADDLRRDVPNMEVDDTIVKLADKICGNETNVVVQARLLYDHVVDTTDHYSKPGAPKSSDRGSVSYCLANKGGGCTDQHALFIALARARGIPTRLHFGSRLTPQNAGKEFDPGYRCWVTFFTPNLGWAPVEISAANTTANKRDFYFGGLDDRRIHFSDGRDLEMSPQQAGRRVNLMISAYVEVDYLPHAQIKRTVRFEEVKGSE